MAVTVALRRLIFVAAVFAVLSIAHSIDDKCAACNAVAEELELGMMKEKPKNHLDMRHRLDSKGQRRGKVIDYRVSELRVVDLLDGLCDKMQDYTLQKLDSTKKVWIKVGSWDDITSIIWKARSVAFRAVAGFDFGCDEEDGGGILLRNGLPHLLGVSDKQESQAYSKDISSYCGRLLEETEDELAELIMKGSVKVGEVRKVMCHELSKHCKQTSGEHDSSHDEEDDEL